MGQATAGVAGPSKVHGLPAGLQRFWRVGINAVRFAWQHAGLIGVLAVALAERIAFFRWWKAFPGGDTYNFILIAQELLRGSYPIAEKRLPLYPLLIAAFHAVLDWEAAAIAVAVISSLASVVLLYALGRTLGVSKNALAIALLPFQAIAPFLFQSIRGYADTTFVALMLGALLAALRAKTWRGAAVTGLLLGLSSLTRFEGIFLAVGVLLVVLVRRPRRLVLPVAGVAGLLWVPFLLFSVHVGRPLTPREYLTDAEQTAFGVTSTREFLQNYWSVWSSVGVDRVWGEPRRLLQDLFSLRLVSVSRLWSVVSDPKELPSLLVLVGMVIFLLRLRVTFMLLVPFLALAVPIAWWGVRQRFLIVLYPLVFLLLALGIHRAFFWWKKFDGRRVWLRPARLATAGTLVLLALFPWRTNNAAEAREVIAKNWGKDYAYYQAIQAARHLPGIIAFEHRSSIALALFGEPDRGRAVFADMHLDARDPAEQWAQLRRWNVRYLVVGEGESKAFPILVDPSTTAHFAVRATFDHPERRGRSQAVVYEVEP